MMTIPAVKAIRDRFPRTHLSWLVEGSVGEFLKDQSFVDEVIIFQRNGFTKALKKGNIAEAINIFASCPRRLRERDYDVILDFHCIAKSVLLSMFVNARKKIGFGRMFAKEKSHFFYDTTINGTDKFMHKVERNILIARHLGYDGPIPSPSLNISGTAETFIDNFLQETGEINPIAVNPFSSRGTDFKRWPLERYGELVLKTFRTSGKRSIILWGPGEKKEAERLKQMCGEGAFLACPTNIPQLFALLKRSSVYVGGDTGVMHLAAAAGTQVISLFGPTDNRINAPFGDRNITLKRDISCSPCKNKSCHDRKCMNYITVDLVSQTLNTVLERSSGN